MIKCASYWSLEGGLAGTHAIADALTEVKAANFKGLELCIGLDGVLTPSSTRTDCENIRNQVDDSGLVVETLASGMSWAFNPTSNYTEVRQTAIDIHAAALERASWLGCKAMLFVPGVVKSPIAPQELIRYDLAVARARDAVKSLLDVAERVGVDLCLENVWNGLFYSPLEFSQFVDSFDSSRLGIYFDVGNVLGYQQHPPHWIELLGKRIKRVHIKDFQESFNWQGSYSFCDLGEGDVPWEASMHALRDIGYDKTIVAEMLPYSPGILQRTSAAMDRILGQVR